MGDRHAFRADWHDYNGGIYFVTICAFEKHHLFGKISEGEMHFSVTGKIVEDCLLEIPHHHAEVELLNHVVMPNHVHIMVSVGAQYFAPAASDQTTTSVINTGCLRAPRHDEPRADNHFNSRLAIVVRSFKAACTIEINRLLTKIPTTMRAQNIAPLQANGKIRLWQRSFHDHLIRDQHAYDNIMNYIDTNVARWDSDCFYK